MLHVVGLPRWMRFTPWMIVSGFLFSATPALSATPLEKALKSNPDALFAIHGSNTIGAHLAPALLTDYLNSQGAAQPELAATSVENERYVMAKLNSQQGRVLVAAHGSSTGFKAMSAGKADIWAASRPAKSKEIDAFKGQADLTSMSSEHVIAIDGLAILIHPRNPVEKLTKEQINLLFSGAIKNWKEVGGRDQAVHVYARDEASGTWDTFKSLVLGDKKLVASAKRYESNDQLSDDVSQDVGGIGFAGFASIRESKAVAVADSDTSPAILPSRLTIATEDYPLSRRLFFYTMGEPKNPLVKDFIEFVLSSKGQTVVGKTGFVEQNLLAVEPNLGDSVPESFKRMTANYQRLSVNFRFSEGRTKLDNKAQRDILRIVDYLKDSNREARDLMLIGFADQQTNEFRAQQISELRALSVQKALKKNGVEVKAFTGYGQYMQVAQSGGQTGASRNGRVEVWIRR
ncbi:substrate-binding domain-containing protein [Hahella ganghwensis]|uniref:substrate-binding domain-containing protein n=1 Tax=Hahella ganghwensis TaxID=286420 RepID=UPI0003608D70|nr:substrate-binding domain-containing protein [Hahella ganghwensis]